MNNLVIGFLLGSVLTAGAVAAGDSYLGTGSGSYLHPSETQVILGEIRVREALETINMQRQNYLDQQIHTAGKLPCQ